MDNYKLGLEMDEVKEWARPSLPSEKESTGKKVFRGTFLVIGLITLGGIYLFSRKTK